MDRFKILKGVPPPPEMPEPLNTLIASKEPSNGICFQFQDGRETYIKFNEDNEVTLDQSFVGTIIGMLDYKGQSITFNGHRITPTFPLVKTSNQTLTIKKSPYG